MVTEDNGWLESRIQVTLINNKMRQYGERNGKNI